MVVDVVLVVGGAIKSVVLVMVGRGVILIVGVLVLGTIGKGTALRVKAMLIKRVVTKETTDPPTAPTQQYKPGTLSLKP